MQKIPAQTKSFIILFAIALVGTYASVKLSHKSFSGDDSGYSVIKYPPENAGQPEEPDQVETIVDTSNWKDYSNSTYGIKFKIAPAWSVKSSPDQYGYKTLTVDPGAKYNNFVIYISDGGYFALDGLPSSTETIAGSSAINIKDMLFGVQNGKYYYTFDIGAALDLKPQFDAMVHSISFQ